jgi:type IV pilus assembly protein PilY1
MAKAVVKASIIWLAMTCASSALARVAAFDDLVVGQEDTVVLGELFNNDDGDGQPIELVGNTAPAVGALTVGLTGSMTFTPPPEWSGEVTFDYTVRSLDAACLVAMPPADCEDVASVVIYVEADADLPTLATGPVNGDEDTAIPLGIGVTFFDELDGSQSFAAAVGNIPPGSVLNAGADQGGGSWLVPPASLDSLTLTPPQDFNGPVVIVVAVQVVDTALDSMGAPINSDIDLASANFLLTIDPVNDDPYQVMAPPDLVTDEDVPASVDLAGVWDDVDRLTNGQGLVYSVVSIDNDAVATATFAGSRLDISLNPNISDPSGTIRVQVSDGIASPLQADVDVQVNPVNDAPVQVGFVSSVDADEDDPPVDVDFSGVFDDVDIATDGDSLSYSAQILSGTAIQSAIMGGSVLTLTFAPDAWGSAQVRVIATDEQGEQSPAYDLAINVDGVNDAPVAVGVIPDVNMGEDDPPQIVSANGIFDDVDIPDGDVLTYEVSGNTAPALFSDLSFVGSDLQITLAADANGAADLSVRVYDTAGERSDPVTFRVNVSSLNDIPVARNDAVAWTEEGGILTIPALDNDYLAETPTIISAVGATTEFTIVDFNGDVRTSPAGTVAIVNNEITYEPAPNFSGVDTFTYTIMDTEGDTSTGTVSVTVANVNDPPFGIQFRPFSMLKNQELIVTAASGVFLGAYDVDGKVLDGDGNEIGSPLEAQVTQFPAAEEGVLDFDPLTGGFTFTPALDFVGVATFRYRLFDNQDFSTLPEYEVAINVNDVPPPPPAPPAGEVAVTFNLSQTPLEQSGAVSPNVLVLMDDSGSMDWNMIIDGLDDQGGFYMSNAGRANGGVREASYRYLWDLKSNAYPPSSEAGLILPTMEALAADGTMVGNEYGVWRARTHKYNPIYYDPNVMYEPWIGLDGASEGFAAADPRAVRLDPVDPGTTIDLLDLHSYDSTGVPEWDTNGGTEKIDVDDMYIPFYYATNATPPLAWNDSYSKVEIKSENAPFAGSADRADCAVGDGDPTDCTYQQELQNFANWFQYHRTREYVTKAAMGGVIAEAQDLRVGYETISNTTSEPVRELNDLYSEGNKRALLDTVYAVDSYGGTPLRQLLDRGGKILGCQTGNDCPALPEPEGICQQNFALLFSDGYWGSGAGTPDNTDIDGVGPKGPFDGGRYSDNVKATLADTAMLYYESDLFVDVDDGVPVTVRDIEGAPEGYFEDGDTMHQHMKTYAIAFGVEGTIDVDAAFNTPVGDPFPWTDPFDAPAHKIDDMVHAAVNGRGRYLSAGNPSELQAALETAFLEFTQAASSTSAAAFNSTALREGTLLYRGFYDLRTRTGELSATAVDANGVLAALPKWLASEKLDTALPSGRMLMTFDPVSQKALPFKHANLTAAQQLSITEDEVDFIRGVRDDELPLGDLREREATGALMGPIVNSSPVFVGEPRAINRDQEPYPTDDLYSDFVSGVSNRTPMVYVGANDGILHGFDAANGVERYGFVPNKILNRQLPYANKLNEFASPFYYHNYYVDLTPRLNDVYTVAPGGGKEWRTILVGGLGAGGKGFFAIDVTDPDATFASEANAAASVMWEFTDDDDTYPVDGNGDPIAGGTLVDPSGNPVKDLGYAVSLPVVQMTNAKDGDGDNRWAAIFGNGVNSTAGIAKLFLLDIGAGVGGWGAGDVKKIDTGYGVALPGEQLEGLPNWLGSPAAIDRDLNGTVDLVYAGDRRGNLYRFDLTSSNADEWKAVRLFTATYFDGATDVVQPIVSRPTVIKHPTETGFLVIFGTGTLLTNSDSENSDVQSIYGIWDRMNDNPATADAGSKSARLVEQTITNVVDDTVNPAQTRRIVSANPVEYVADGINPGVYGWYIDLDMVRADQTVSGFANPDTTGNAAPDPQFPGEKAIRRILFRDGTLITTTVLPTTNESSCLGARPGAILVMDALTGGDANRPVIDFNTDGVVDEGDLVTVGGVEFSGGLLFQQGDLDGSLVDLSTLGGAGDTDFLFVSGGDETIAFRIDDLNDSKTGRLSWIELDGSN